MNTWIKSKLITILSSYFKDIKEGSINLSFLKGVCEMSDIHLKEDVLADLIQLPQNVHIKNAVCRTLFIKVPWSSIKEEPITIELQDVKICARRYEHPRDLLIPVDSNKPKGESYSFIEKAMDGCRVIVHNVSISIICNVNNEVNVHSDDDSTISLEIPNISFDNQTSQWTHTDKLKQCLIETTTSSKCSIITFRKLLSIPSLKIEIKQNEDKTDQNNISRLVLTSLNCRMEFKRNSNDGRMIQSVWNGVITQIYCYLTLQSIEMVISLIGKLNTIRSNNPLLDNISMCSDYSQNSNQSSSAFSTNQTQLSSDPSNKNTLLLTLNSKFSIQILTFNVTLCTFLNDNYTKNVMISGSNMLLWFSLTGLFNMKNFFNLSPPIKRFNSLNSIIGDWLQRVRPFDTFPIKAYQIALTLDDCQININLFDGKTNIANQEIFETVIDDNKQLPVIGFHYYFSIDDNHQPNQSIKENKQQHYTCSYLSINQFNIYLSIDLIDYIFELKVQLDKILTKIMLHLTNNDSNTPLETFQKSYSINISKVQIKIKNEATTMSSPPTPTRSPSRSSSSLNIQKVNEKAAILETIDLSIDDLLITNRFFASDPSIQFNVLEKSIDNCQFIFQTIKDYSPMSEISAWIDSATGFEENKMSNHSLNLSNHSSNPFNSSNPTDSPSFFDSTNFSCARMTGFCCSLFENPLNFHFWIEYTTLSSISFQLSLMINIDGKFKIIIDQNLANFLHAFINKLIKTYFNSKLYVDSHNSDISTKFSYSINIIIDCPSFSIATHDQTYNQGNKDFVFTFLNNTLIHKSDSTGASSFRMHSKIIHLGSFTTTTTNNNNINPSSLSKHNCLEISLDHVPTSIEWVASIDLYVIHGDISLESEKLVNFANICLCFFGLNQNESPQTTNDPVNLNGDNVTRKIIVSLSSSFDLKFCSANNLDYKLKTPNGLMIEYNLNERTCSISPLILTK